MQTNTRSVRKANISDFVNGSSNTAVGTDSSGGPCQNNQPASLSYAWYLSSVTVLRGRNPYMFKLMVDYGFFSHFRSLNFTF